MKFDPRMAYKVPCPNCGADVDVMFTGTFAPHDPKSATYTLTMTQAAPMVCICGFTYAPGGNA